MNIVLKYKHGEDVIVEYNPNVASIVTRHPDTDERFIKAFCPEEIRGETEYLNRLKSSCKHDVDPESIIEFIDE